MSDSWSPGWISREGITSNCRQIWSFNGIMSLCVSSIVEASMNKKAQLTPCWNFKSNFFLKTVTSVISEPGFSMGVYENCYHPQRSCGNVMFLHLSVILFTRGGGLPQPPVRHSPWADAPLGRHLPGRHPLARPPLGGASWVIWATSGRYTSY